MAKSPKPPSNRKLGDTMENKIFKLLEDAEWRWWKPPPAKFRAQDIFGVFDSLAVRFDARVLAPQVGTIGMMSNKRTQVDELMKDILSKGEEILGHLAPQIWGYGETYKDGRHIRVEERFGLSTGWVEVGRCTLDGKPLEGYDFPWPLRRPGTDRWIEATATATVQVSSTASGRVSTTMSVPPIGPQVPVLLLPAETP